MKRWQAGGSRSAIHRPHPMLEWVTVTQPVLSVHWGDGYSAPVWWIEWWPGPLLSRLIAAAPFIPGPV